MSVPLVRSAYDLLDCNTLAAGDADVINTTLALIEPCLDELNVLANIGVETIPKLTGVKTLSDQSGIADIELWNGLFVTKGTSQEVIDVLARIASETMAGEEAQTLMKETGARVYWKNTQESEAIIAKTRKQLAEIEEVLAK